MPAQVTVEINVNKHLHLKKPNNSFLVSKLYKNAKAKKPDQDPFPNTPASWGIKRATTLVNLQKHIESGKAIRFGVFNSNGSDLWALKERLNVQKWYELCDIVHGYATGFYVDIDGCTKEVFDRAFADQYIKQHCFLANYSASSDHESTGIYRFHMVFLYAENQSYITSISYVKSVFHRLNTEVFNGSAGSKGKDGSLDSGCFEPTRIKFGSKDKSVFYVNESAAKIETATIIEKGDEYDQLNKSDQGVSLNILKDLDLKPDSPKSLVYFLSLRECLFAKGYPLDKIETWEAPIEGFNPQWGDIRHETVQGLNSTQYNGIDIRTVNLGSQSRSLSLSFLENGWILYYARGRGTGGSYLDYLRDWFIFSQYDTETAAKVLQAKGVETELFFPAIETFLESKDCDLELFRETVKRNLSLKDSVDVSEEFDTEDLLVDSSVLECLDTSKICRTEEVAKDTFKHFINGDFIFKVFVSYYRDRVVKTIDKSGNISYFWYEHVKGTCAYYWTAISASFLESKVWVFAEKLLEQLSLSFETIQSMRERGARVFAIALAQNRCKLKQVFDFLVYENTDFRPYKNGLFRLKDNQLIPYDPNHFTSYVLPFDYQPVYQSRHVDLLKEYIRKSIDTTLSEADQQQIFDFYLELIFLTMNGKASDIKLYIWLTAESNSGKSSFVQVISALINPFYELRSDEAYHESLKGFARKSRTAEESPANLLNEANRFKNEVFVEAFLISMDDKRGITASQVDELKKIVTPNATMRREKKGGDITFVPNKALIIFTGEQDPTFSFNNQGGVNRLCLIDYRRQDTHLYESVVKMFTSLDIRQELDNYFMTQYSAAIVTAKYQTLPKVLLDRQKRFVAENDPVTQFLDTCLEYDPSYYQKAKVIYATYSLFDQNCIKFKTTDHLLAKKLKPALTKKNVTSANTERGKDKGILFLGCRLKTFEEIREYLHFKDDYHEHNFPLEMGISA